MPLTSLSNKIEPVSPASMQVVTVPLLSQNDYDSNDSKRSLFQERARIQNFE